MKRPLVAIGASLTLALSLLVGTAAVAQDTAKAPTTGSTKPHMGNGPKDEKSLPSSAPKPTTKHTTGAMNQDPTVKAMNNEAKAKVETEGK